MSAKEIVVSRIMAIMMVVFINICLFIFMWQSSLYDNTIIAVKKNEQVLASLKDENRSLVASKLVNGGYEESQLASIVYKKNI